MLGFQAQRVSHAYAANTVLKNIDLEIPPGSRFALVGHNGAGKSTLLRLLARLEKPTRGGISVTDSRNRQAEELALRRCIVLLLQRPYLFEGTVLSNVLFGLKVRGIGRHAARERALAALRTTGLEELSSRSAKRLSGGESQLLAIARAIALEPEAILLDEVTAHLDPPNEAKVEQIVKDFNQQTGGTVVFVTQNLSQACRLATEGAVIHQGEITEQGKLPDLLITPQDARTLQFVQGYTLHVKADRL